jgi:hypothetical protein
VALGHELVLAGPIMHQQRIGIAEHQRLAGADRQHMDLQAAGGPEQRKDVTKQTGILGGSGRAERDEIDLDAALGMSRAEEEERSEERSSDHGLLSREPHNRGDNELAASAGTSFCGTPGK